MKIGFIGLGQMGRAMAGRLLDAGHALMLYNRSRAAAEAFRARGAVVADAPTQALDRCERAASALASLALLLPQL